MSEQVFYYSSNAQNYSDNLKKLLRDIYDEVDKGIQDGLAYKLAGVEDDESKVYSFLKNEGYDITYKEFSDFVNDCNDTIKVNGQLFQDVTNEQMTSELSDSDLEQVAGGMKLWQKLLIGVGAALLVGAIILTAGLATPAVVAGTAGGALATMSTSACFGLAVTAATGTATATAASVTTIVAGGLGIASLAAGGIGAAVDK